MDPLVISVKSKNFSIEEKPMDPGLLLPKEIMTQIFSYLNDPVDLKSAGAVNRFWRLMTLDQKLSLSIDFVNFLDENLNNKSYSIQKESFLKIKHAISDTDHTLVSFIHKTHKARENILNTLKNERNEDLSVVEKSVQEGKFKFFKNAFELTRIYKKIEQINNQAYQNQLDQVSRNTIRDNALKESCKSLIKIGSLSKANEVALTLFDPRKKDLCLVDICVKLEELDLLTQAKETAQTISAPATRSYCIGYYSLLIQSKGDIDKAIESAQEELNPKEALQSIYWGLMWKGDAVKAKEVHASITHKKRKGCCVLM